MFFHYCNIGDKDSVNREKYKKKLFFFSTDVLPVLGFLLEISKIVQTERRMEKRNCFLHSVSLPLEFPVISTIFALCYIIIMYMDGTKQPLLGLTLDELKQVAARMGMPSFAAKQMAQWLYVKRVKDINEMTNLSLRHRESLSQEYVVGREAPVEAMRSVDGTVKYLFQVGTAGAVESVYIPSEEGGRATLCVSSQVGCKMNCLFCMTGKQGFAAHLTATQILNQVLSVPESENLTNVVLMGMGEPFDNIDNVLRALELMTADYGLAWSPKRITVSTVGVMRGLRRFLDESECL